MRLSDFYASLFSNILLTTPGECLNRFPRSAPFFRLAIVYRARSFGLIPFDPEASEG